MYTVRAIETCPGTRRQILNIEKMVDGLKNKTVNQYGDILVVTTKDGFEIYLTNSLWVMVKIEPSKKIDGPGIFNESYKLESGSEIHLLHTPDGWKCYCKIDGDWYINGIDADRKRAKELFFLNIPAPVEFEDVEKNIKIIKAHGNKTMRTKNGMKTVKPVKSFYYKNILFHVVKHTGCWDVIENNSGYRVSAHPNNSSRASAINDTLEFWKGRSLERSIEVIKDQSEKGNLNQ